MHGKDLDHSYLRKLFDASIVENDLDLPAAVASESSLRVLVPLDKESRIAAWGAAMSKVENGNFPTAKQVRAAIKDIQGNSQKSPLNQLAEMLLKSMKKDNEVNSAISFFKLNTSQRKLCIKVIRELSDEEVKVLMKKVSRKRAPNKTVPPFLINYHDNRFIIPSWK